jgi:hypothetical protein
VIARLSLPLFNGSDTTVMEHLRARYALQAQMKISQGAMAGMSTLAQAEMPPGNNVPGWKSATDMIDKHIFPGERQVHMCPAGHVAFVNSLWDSERQYADLHACPVPTCGASRYKEGTLTPVSVFHYLPLGQLVASVHARGELVALLLKCLTDAPNLAASDDIQHTRGFRERMNADPDFAKDVSFLCSLHFCISNVTFDVHCSPLYIKCHLCISNITFTPATSAHSLIPAGSLACHDHTLTNTTSQTT